MMSFADDYIKLRGDHSAKQGRQERWRENRDSSRAKPRGRGKSDVTPTSWAYASEGELEREPSGDFSGRGPLERYDGPSAQDIGAYSFPVSEDAPAVAEQPARRLGAPQREQWAPEDWRALGEGQPAADDPLANIRARAAQSDAGRQSDRPAWEAAAGRVLPEETQPREGAPFQTYYDSHLPLIVEGPRRLAEEAISLGADSLTWPIDQGARDRMDNRAEFLGRFARGLGDAVGNMPIGEDTSIAGRERQAAEQERNFQRNIRLNDYAEQIRRPERYLGTAEPLDVTVQGPSTGERVGRFIDETVGYRGTEEFLREPEAQYQGADFRGDIARERENARRLGVSPENMPDTSMAPLPSDQYERQAEASSVPVGLTVGLSSLEFAPGVGLVPDIAAAGRATARGVGRDAWRLGQRVGALDATDELPYAFVAREGAEDAPGLLTGQYRDRVRTPVIAAGVTGAGVEAADDNFGDDPLASSIAAGSAAALTRRLGGAEAESGVRRVAARRLSEGSGAEPINAEFFPTNQPAEMAVREYQPAEGTVVRVEPDGRVVMTYQGAYQSGASDARAAGSGAEAVRTWRATLRALEDDIAATQRPEYHWTPGPDGAPDERLAQFYREAMSRRAPEGYVFSETPDGVMHLTRERPVRFGEELDMRTGQIRPASPIDLEAPDLRLADDLQLGNYPRRDPAPQSESSNGIPPRRLGATDAPDAGPVGGETLLSAETGQMRPEGALSLQAARTGGNIGEINGVQRLGDTAVRRGVTETTDLLGEQPQPLERINGDLLGLQGAGVNFPTNQGQRSVGSSHQLPPRHEAANVDGTSAGSQHRQPRTRASYEEAIEKARQDYDYVGLRTDDGPLSPELRSRVWDDGEPTGEMLDGLSVTDVNAPEVWSMHNFEPPRRGGHYFGENTYVIAGNRAYAGRDRGELVITDPVIILDPARARAAPTRIPWTAPDGGARGAPDAPTAGPRRLGQDPEIGNVPRQDPPVEAAPRSNIPGSSDQVGRVRRLGAPASSPDPSLNAVGEQLGNEASTQADFTARLPSNPGQWRELIGAHPWISRPSRAQVVIMASARDEGGRFIYSTDDILRETGISTEASLNAQLSQARRAGVPIPVRSGGPGGATRPLGGANAAAIVDLMERMERQGVYLTSSQIAERLQIASASAVNTTLSKVAGDLRAAPDLARRARAVLEARRTRRSGARLPRNDSPEAMAGRRALRGEYDEADLVNSALQRDANGNLASNAGLAMDLRDDVSDAAVKGVSAQTARLVRRAEEAVSQGEEAIAVLAQQWRVTPDRVVEMASRAEQSRGFSAAREAGRLVAEGVTEPAALMAGIRERANAVGAQVSEGSLRVIASNARKNAGLTQPITASGARLGRRRLGDTTDALALAAGAGGAAWALSDDASADDMTAGEAIDAYGQADTDADWQIVPPRGDRIPSLIGARQIGRADGEYLTLQTADGRRFRMHVMRGFDVDANQPGMSMSVVGELVPRQAGGDAAQGDAETPVRRLGNLAQLARPIASTAAGVFLGQRVHHPVAGPVAAGASAYTFDAIGGGSDHEALLAGAAAAGLRGAAPAMRADAALEAAARGPAFEARRDAYAATLSAEPQTLRGTRLRGDDYLGSRATVETDAPLETPMGDAGRQRQRIIVPGAEAAEQGYTTRLGASASPREQFEALPPVAQLEWMNEAEAVVADQQRRLGAFEDRRGIGGGKLPAPTTRVPEDEGSFPIGFYDPKTGRPLFGSNGRQPPPPRPRKPFDELSASGQARRVGSAADQIRAAREMGVGDYDRGADAMRALRDRAASDPAFMARLRDRFPSIAALILGGGAVGSEVVSGGQRRLGAAR